MRHHVEMLMQSAICIDQVFPFYRKYGPRPALRCNRNGASFGDRDSLSAHRELALAHCCRCQRNRRLTLCLTSRCDQTHREFQTSRSRDFPIGRGYLKLRRVAVGGMIGAVER